LGVKGWRGFKGERVRGWRGLKGVKQTDKPNE